MYLYQTAYYQHLPTPFHFKEFQQKKHTGTKRRYIIRLNSTKNKKKRKRKNIIILLKKTASKKQQTKAHKSQKTPFYLSSFAARFRPACKPLQSGSLDNKEKAKCQFGNAESLRAEKSLGFVVGWSPKHDKTI